MQILNPEGIYNSPRYYSGGKVGNTIFTAGRVAKNLDGSVFAPGDSRRQAEHIMECLKAILDEGGATFQDVVKIHTYYVDDSDALYTSHWPTVHEVRQRYMGDHYPPHTGTKVANLGSPDIKLEIEVTAVIRERPTYSSAKGGPMSMKTLNPEGIYNSPLYCSGGKAGNTIYTAGIVPLDLEGNVVAPNDARRQTEKIMKDLKLILAEGGATLQDVVYVHTYFVHNEDMPVIHEVRQRYMGDHYPSHTGTKVDNTSWVERGIKLEIEVIAVVED